MPIFKINDIIKSRENKLLQEFVGYNLQKEFNVKEKWQLMVDRGYVGHIRIKLYMNNKNKEEVTIPIIPANNIFDVINDKALHYTSRECERNVNKNGALARAAGFIVFFNERLLQISTEIRNGASEGNYKDEIESLGRFYYVNVLHTDKDCDAKDVQRYIDDFRRNNRIWKNL